MIDTFMRGVAVRTDATEAHPNTSSAGKGSKRKRRGRHSNERVAQADTSQGNGDQRPEEKKAKVERPTVERDTSSVDTPTETAESGGFQDAPKRRRGQRGGVGRKRLGGGKSALADSNPRKHGTEPVSLLRPPAKTQKVSQAKVAASKIAKKLSKAAAAKRVSRQKRAPTL